VTSLRAQITFLVIILPIIALKLRIVQTVHMEIEHRHTVNLIAQFLAIMRIILQKLVKLHALQALDKIIQGCALLHVQVKITYYSPNTEIL
jgi:hypothetical protein